MSKRKSFYGRIERMIEQDLPAFEDVPRPLLAARQEEHELVLMKVWEVFGEYIDAVREKRKDLGPKYQVEKTSWLLIFAQIMTETTGQSFDISNPFLESYYQEMMHLSARKNSQRIQDLLGFIPSVTAPKRLAETQKEHENILIKIYQAINSYTSTRRTPEISRQTVDGIWAQMLWEKTQHPYFERLSNPTSQEELDAFDFSALHAYQEEALAIVRARQEDQFRALQTRWEEEEDENPRELSEKDMDRLWKWNE